MRTRYAFIRVFINLTFYDVYINMYISKLAFVSLMSIILGVIKRNPLFLHEIEWKNNGFLFTTPNICMLFIYARMYVWFQNQEAYHISYRHIYEFSNIVYFVHNLNIYFVSYIKVSYTFRNKADFINEDIAL